MTEYEPVSISASGKGSNSYPMTLSLPAYSSASTDASTSATPAPAMANSYFTGLYRANEGLGGSSGSGVPMPLYRGEEAVTSLSPYVSIPLPSVEADQAPASRPQESSSEEEEEEAHPGPSKKRRKVRCYALGPMLEMLKKKGAPPIPRRRDPSPEPEQQEELPPDMTGWLAEEAPVDDMMGQDSSSQVVKIDPMADKPEYYQEWAPSMLTDDAALDDETTAAYYNRYVSWWNFYAAKCAERAANMEIMEQNAKKRKRKTQKSTEEEYTWEDDPWGFKFYGIEPKSGQTGEGEDDSSVPLSASLRSVMQYGADGLTSISANYDEEAALAAQAVAVKKKKEKRLRAKENKKKREAGVGGSSSVATQSNNNVDEEPKDPAKEDDLLQFLTEAFPEVDLRVLEGSLKGEGDGEKKDETTSQEAGAMATTTQPPEEGEKANGPAAPSLPPQLQSLLKTLKSIGGKPGEELGAQDSALKRSLFLTATSLQKENTRAQALRTAQEKQRVKNRDAMYQELWTADLERSWQHPWESDWTHHWDKEREWEDVNMLSVGDDLVGRVEDRLLKGSLVYQKESDRDREIVRLQKHVQNILERMLAASPAQRPALEQAFQQAKASLARLQKAKTVDVIRHGSVMQQGGVLDVPWGDVAVTTFAIEQEIRQTITVHVLLNEVLPMYRKILLMNPETVYRKPEGEPAEKSHRLLCRGIFNICDFLVYGSGDRNSAVEYVFPGHASTWEPMLDFLTRFYAILYEALIPDGSARFRHRPIVEYVMKLRLLHKNRRVNIENEERFKRLYAQLSHFVELPGTLLDETASQEIAQSINRSTRKHHQRREPVQQPAPPPPSTPTSAQPSTTQAASSSGSSASAVAVNVDDPDEEDLESLLQILKPKVLKSGPSDLFIPPPPPPPPPPSEPMAPPPPPPPATSAPTTASATLSKLLGIMKPPAKPAALPSKPTAMSLPSAADTEHLGTVDDLMSLLEDASSLVSAPPKPKPAPAPQPRPVLAAPVATDIATFKYRCPVCPMLFTTMAKCIRHLPSEHKYPICPPKSLSNPTDEFACLECGNSYPGWGPCLQHLEETNHFPNPIAQIPMRHELSKVVNQPTFADFVGPITTTTTADGMDEPFKMKYRCPSCGNMFTRWALCLEHLTKTQHKPASNTSDPRAMQDLAEWDRNKEKLCLISTQKQRLPYRCPECGRWYANWPACLNHLTVTGHFPAVIKERTDQKEAMCLARNQVA